MAKKIQKNTKTEIKAQSEKSKSQAPVAEKEKLTKNQIIILVCILLAAIMVSGVIIGTVIMIKKIKNPDFMTSDLSRYISISSEDYRGYDINIPLDEVSDETIQNKIYGLLTEYKEANEAYGSKYPANIAITLGNSVHLYYRGYTIDEKGREVDFEGSSNYNDENGPTVIEAGSGKVIEIDATTNAETVAGSFIQGFGEGLLGVIPSEYPEFVKISEGGRIMPGDVIYLSYTVIGGKDGVNKTVTAERIDLALPYVDELYGEGFTEFFIGTTNEDGMVDGFKNVGESVTSAIFRIDGATTDTVYSDMKIEFATRGCENEPLTIKVKFPADYNESSLRGKEAYFDIFIDRVRVWDTPEFTDQFITEKLKVTAEELSEYSGETLAEKYRAKLKAECEKEIEESNHNLLIEAMWDYLASKVEIKKIPEKTLESYYNYYFNIIYQYYYDGGYSSYYSDIGQFAILYINSVYGAGLSESDDWQAYLTSLAEGDVVQNIVFYYIIREEGFIPEGEEYQKIYDMLYNEVLDYYLDLHKDEFAEYDEATYKKELDILKAEIEKEYGDSYFKERTYYYYGTRKMLELANIVK